MNNDIQPIIKKVANNILEFLIDPTVYPPERHIYFRPEETLENSFYENAKKDSKKDYGDQRQNSDFYPNRPIREASIMERKILIASLDVLSQEFNESDPIGKDLRTMAFAVAGMSEEEFKGRLSGDKEAGNPWIEHMNKVRKDNPGKSFKEIASLAKKTFKKAEEPVEKEAGKKKGPGIPDGTGPMKDSPLCPKSEKSEKEATEIKDFWNKEAAEAVRKSLIAEVSDACDDKKKEKKEEKEAATSPDEEDPKKEVEAKKKKEPEEKVIEEEKVEVEEVVPENGDSGKEAKCDPSHKEEDEKEATEVDTDLLNASSVFEGIELQAGLITTDDIPDLSATEKERLGQLFK